MRFIIRISASLIFVIALLLFFSCNRGSGFDNEKVVKCSAEKLTKNKKSFVADENSSFLFNGGKHQTDKESRSGKYSVVSTKASPYVFTHTIKNTGPDLFFRASVWRKSKGEGYGVLVVSDKTAKKLYQVIRDPVEKDKNGWEKLELEFFTPPNFIKEDVKIYCWSNGVDSVYFDDIEIEFTHKTYPIYEEEPLVIVLDTLDYQKLLRKRIKAFDAGVLQSGNNDWVKGIVFGDNRMMKAKMRLKGDWLDHLVGDKWSFRIKMRKNYSWKRMRVFSIQTPLARGFLKEWYSHKLYESKDILTTRYGFVPVVLGSRSKGLYAWEEHFVKQLIESRNRREGPILKFSEDAFWQMQRVAKLTGKWADLPFYNASVIEPFSQGKTVKNPALFRQFLIGQKLMDQYKFTKTKPANIFDLPKLAKYYAMLDITHARHGMAWHNQRYYYNPVICKLEPIAYDGYTDHTKINTSISDNMAYKLLVREKPFDGPNFCFLFEDTTFLNLYITYLEDYSSVRFADSMTKVLEHETAVYDSLINKEFPYVHFNKNFLKESAKGVRDYLPQLKKFLAEKIATNTLYVNSGNEDNSDSVTLLNTPAYFVTAYTESSVADSMVIGVHNYFGKNIKLIGTGIKKKFIMNYFPDKIDMKAYVKGENGVERSVVSNTGMLYLFFHISGMDEIYSVEINPWPYPSGITPRQELDSTMDLANCLAVDTVIGNEIYIKTGKISIDKPVVIPEGYRVIFKPGTQIDLVKQAMFISYSPVFMTGEEGNPVVVSSSDKTGNGFSVLQAEGRSVLNHVVFKDMNTLNYKGWTLTGAVTFYESNVDITNTRFVDNQCEDALNIVRSDFVLRNSYFKGTWGDAFDSDFSTGLVDGVIFTEIGNDAIDFSGSEIEITNTTINGAQDKGVSGGEDSHLKVSNTTISNANIGLASKDLSSLDVTDSKIDHCKYGLVLLQKKPEYGPATMNLKKVSITNTSTKFLIEKGSRVVFDRRIFEGDRKNVAEMFY